MTATDETATRTVIPAIVRTVVSYELGMWRSLYRWTFRRPVTREPGAGVFGYAATLTPVFLAFIGVSAIELPILHLLLPWETVRLVADVLGAYGLFWMVGLLASMRVHPHIVSGSGLRIRHGTTVDITIPWDAVAAIRTRNRPAGKSRAVQFERTQSGLVAQIVILSQTNIDITLREPMLIPLAKAGGEPITELRCYADDPDAFAAKARAHVRATRPPDSV